MLIAIVLSAVLMLLTVLLHYESIRLVGAVRRRWRPPPRLEILASVSMALVAHLLSVALYVLAFVVMAQDPQLGALHGNIGSDLVDFSYFSLSCYTTLSLGDMYVDGPMRILAGIEALNGLVLIAWSASSTFVAMERMAREEERGME